MGLMLRRRLEWTVVLVCAASPVEGQHESSLVDLELSKEIVVKLNEQMFASGEACVNLDTGSCVDHDYGLFHP